MDIDIEYAILLSILGTLIFITIILEIVKCVYKRYAIQIYEISVAEAIDGTENNTLENSRSTIQVVYGTV
jgi:hypothetical protein